MSDEEGFLDEGVTGEEEQPGGARTGFLPAIVITILKWAAIALGAIIFVVTVVIITNKVTGRGREVAAIAPYSPEYEQDSVEREYFNTDLDSIRGTTADDPPVSFLASVTLGYEAGKTVVQTELVSKKEIIRNTVLKYFGQKKAADLLTQNFGRLEDELTTIINGRLRRGQIIELLIMELQTF
jgi:flagellar FliL protein